MPAQTLHHVSGLTEPLAASDTPGDRQAQDSLLPKGVDGFSGELAGGVHLNGVRGNDLIDDALKRILVTSQCQSSFFCLMD